MLLQQDKYVKQNDKTMKKVTGIGGVFFKSQDPERLKEWYKKHLDLPINQWGCSFEYDPAAEDAQKSSIQWSPFKADTTYFEPSKKPFMINYTVADLEALVAELKKEGVTIVDEIAVYEYGKFVHIMDCDGNKIELWEPIDH